MISLDSEMSTEQTSMRWVAQGPTMNPERCWHGVQLDEHGKKPLFSACASPDSFASLSGQEFAKLGSTNLPTNFFVHPLQTTRKDGAPGDWCVTFCVEKPEISLICA